jgi:hypothetical protein
MASTAMIYMVIKRQKEKPTWKWNISWTHHKQACYHLSYRWWYENATLYKSIKEQWRESNLKKKKKLCVYT